jgi:membrane protein DedA with SNARE-associated domain
MGLFQFLLYSTIGTVVWTSLLAICGYILRDRWSAVESYISPISTVLIVVLVLWFASRYVRQWRGRRRQKQEMSQQAGE